MGRSYRDRDTCDISVGQTIIVPFDVMSQHMMVLGLNPRTGTKEVSANPLAVPTEGRTKAQITYDIARTIYVRDGFRGFYRGYVASLCTYVPSSACWWTFYSSYQVGVTDMCWWSMMIFRCSEPPSPRSGPRLPWCSVWPLWHQVGTLIFNTLMTWNVDQVAQRVSSQIH